MTYPIETRVVIDGVEAFSRGEDLADGHPIVLDGIQFPWGRQTNVDQPDVGTIQCQIRQQLNAPGSGDVSMLDIIHTGSTLEVWAKATIPAANGEAMTETGFPITGALDPNRWMHASGSSVSAVDVTTRKGRRSAWVTSTESSWTSGLVFPPAQFQPVGTNPDSWDLIPRLLPDGDPWPVEVTAWVPPGAAAKVIAYAYAAPNKTPAPVACTVVNELGQPVTIPAVGDWRTVSGFVSLPAGFDVDGAWIAPGILLDPMPSQTSIQDMPGEVDDQPAFSFDDYTRAGIFEVSLITQGPTVRDVLVWSGEVTSAVGKAVGPWAIQLDVTASDAGAELSNATISDSAWVKQSLSARVDRIETLAAKSVVVDPSLGDFQLTYRDDINAQAVLPLLQDLAQSVGGVMWVATHATSGPYLWMEDPQSRVPLRRFSIDAVTNTVTIGGNSRDVSIISASDMLLDPVQWTQDVQQVTTSVDVTWQQQSVDSDGTPVADAQTVTVTDDAAKVIYGLRKMSVDTELTTEADATELANRLLSQARNTGWVVDGLTIDSQLIQQDLDELDYSTRLTALMDLLDGTRRLGRGMILIDLPAWTPSGTSASVYLEGGQYSLNHGTWTLQLLASPATSGGQAMSATFDDFADVEVTVADFGTIRITDAYGVAGPGVGVLAGFGGGMFGADPFGA